MDEEISMKKQRVIQWVISLILIVCLVLVIYHNSSKENQKRYDKIKIQERALKKARIVGHSIEVFQDIPSYRYFILKNRQDNYKRTTEFGGWGDE